jgi:predicted GIY-YIG superfamily endonuclease
MIYLLHFHDRIHPDHSCQHYIGYTSSLHDRIHQHLHNTSGVRLIQVAHHRQIPFSIVRCWHGNQQLERYLKSLKNSPKFCPLCTQNPWHLYFPNSLPARELTGNTLKDHLLFN